MADINEKDLSLSTRLRKHNYENYIESGEINSSGIDYKSVLDDLSTYNNKPLEEAEDKSYDNDLNTFELISNAFKSTMVGMNEAQLSATKGVLRRDVLPNIDKIKFNINLFSQYDDLNNKKDSILNRLATSQNENEIVSLQNELSKTNEEIDNIKNNLISLGVTPDMSNADEVKAKQEIDLANYQDQAERLYEDIKIDEQDINDWKVDDRFQKKMDENPEFKWSEPSKWIYQIPSTIGSSSSSAIWQVAPYASTIVKEVLKKQLIKTAATVATSSAAGSIIPGAGTAAGAAIGTAASLASSALDLANAGMLIYSNYKQAADEANANVSDEYGTRVETILNQNGITKEDLVNQAKLEGISEEFSKLSDDKIFEKILDGQIKINSPELNSAVSSARTGLDGLYAQNMAITFGANLLEDKLFLPYFGKIANGWVDKALNVGSTLSNPIGAAEEALVNAAKKKLTKYSLGRNAIDAQSKKLLKRAKDIAYFGTDLALRNAANSLNEAVEEGAQYTSGKAYSEGKLDDVQMNLEGLATSVFNAYKEKGRTLVNILGNPFGYQDALYNNDSEYWQNVKLGAAASLLSPFNVMATAKGVHSNYKELKGMDKVNQLAANEINTKEEMEKAIEYAGGKYDKVRSEIVNSWMNLANGPEENLPEGFTKEDAKKEAEFAAKAFRLSENNEMIALADALDIKKGTQEFGELIGLYMQAEKEYKAAVTDYNEAKNKNDEFPSATLSNTTDRLFESLNKDAKDSREIISKDDIRKSFSLIRDLNIVDSMLDEVNSAISTLNDTKNEAEFMGNQYTTAKLEDFKFRLESRKNDLKNSIFTALNTKDESKINQVNAAVISLEVFDNVRDINNAAGNKIISGLNLERNQEIINSFIGTGRIDLTNTEKSKKRSIKRSDSTNKRKKLKLKALRNIHDNVGVGLIEEMYNLYKTKQDESKELSEALIENKPTEITPVRTERSTRTVETGTITTPEVSPAETVTEVSQDTKKESEQSLPENEAQKEMDEAEAALIAAAEAQDSVLNRPRVTNRPIVQPNQNRNLKPTSNVVSTPIVTTETKEASPKVEVSVDSTEKYTKPADSAPVDPFAGGEGMPVYDDTPSNDDPFTPVESTEKKAEPVSTTEQKKESAREKVKSDLENAREEYNKNLDEFISILREDTLGFAYDPKAQAERQTRLFSAFFNLLTSAFNLGKYKFKEVTLDIYDKLNKNRADLEKYFNTIKGVYSSVYWNIPEEKRINMSTPSEVEAITIDDLFDTPVPDLTEAQKESVVEAGIVEKPKTELPADAITDAQLADFSEDSELGILNTFHYRPDVLEGETIPFEDTSITFSPNSELPDIFINRSNDLKYEYSVAQFIDYKTKNKKVNWANPKTYDWARVGIIITDMATGKRYWVAMRSPLNIRLSKESSQNEAEIKAKLRARRAQIISNFVKQDENGKLLNEVDYNVKVEPTRMLLHNSVDGVISKVEPISSSKFKNILQLSENLDEELDNFGYSTGVRSNETIYTIYGDNTGFNGSTAGGVYYIINGNKRLSGRTLPLKLTMQRFNIYPNLCDVLSEIIFSYGFSSNNKYGNTELQYADIVNLFLNWGESTTVNPNSNLNAAAKTNLTNKQLYIDNKGMYGVLHFGRNSVQMQGLSQDRKNAEKKAFREWLMQYGSMPFKVQTNDAAANIAVNTKMKDLFDGRLAKSVEDAKGNLVLFDGINITTEDLNHTMLAWLIRNNMIGSNLNADKYNRPYVIADGITKSLPTTIPQPVVTPEVVSQKQEDTKPIEEKSTRKRRTFRDLDSLGGSNKEIKVPFTPNKAYTTDEKMDKSNARKFLEDTLGMSPNEIQIIDVVMSSDKPATAMSYMTKDAIVLYTSDPYGVEYHEAYHRVSLLLMSNEERQKIYSEYRRTHKNMENASDKVVEEALAEDFRYFMTKRVPSKSYKITKWFDKLVDFIKTMFGRTSINSIFRGIYEGKYKNIPVNRESKKRFEEAYSNRVNFVQGGHQFKNIKSLDNYFQAVEFFTISYINKSFEEQGVVNDLTKINLDFDDMKMLLEDLSYDPEATPEQRAAVKELYDNFDVFKKDIESQLSSLNLKEVEEENEYNDTEERDGGEIEKDNFDKYDKASYEVSVLHNLRPAVKLFLSSIEDRLNNNGTYVRDYNPETGLPKVTPFMTAWRRIVDKLYDVDSYQELISESAKLAKSDPFFASVYDKLTRVSNENFRTQILQTITGYRHNFLTVGYSNIGEDGNTVYIANLGGSVNLRNGKRILSDWNRNFYNSTMVTVDESGNRIPNKAALKQVQDELNNLVKTLSKMTDSNTMEELNDILYKYVDLLNKVGIDVSYDTLYKAITNLTFNNNSVDKSTLLSSAKVLLTSNRDVSVYKSLFNVLKEPVKNTGKIKKTIDSVFTSETPLLNLAIIHYQLNSNNLEEKVLGPKNTAVYPLSKHNYITLEVKKMNNDRAYVKDLLKCPINQSSLIYNTLANNENVKLTVGTLLNITEYGSGGTGVDYQSAPRIETFIAKLVCSENDMIWLPTMSDKKTYMPIQGVKLFKNRTLNVEQLEDGSMNITFSDAVLDQFYRYYKSEYDAILQYRFLKANEDKIDLKNKPNAYIKKGNGGKFRIFRGVFRKENGKRVYIDFASLSDEELASLFSKENEANLKNDINTTLDYWLDNQLEYVEKLGLIENKNGLYKNKFLPSTFISDRENSFSNSFNSLAGDQNKKYRENLAILDVIATFVVNNNVSMAEVEKVLHKDVAFYKNYPDVSKRLAGTLSTGTRPRTQFSDPNSIFNRVPRYKNGKYNVAGLKDIELRTNQPKELYNKIYNAYIRELMENSGEFTKEYIDEVFKSNELYNDERIPENIRDLAKKSVERDLSLYGDVKMDKDGNIVVNEENTPINQADASVYCSPTMYKALLAAHGELEPEVEEAIDFIEAYGDDPSIGDIRKYVKTLMAAMSPKKMIYFGHELLQPLPGQYIDMPIFNKMAVFPLFKVLTTGDLRKLYDRMVDEKNPIDMFTTHSAVKVGDIIEYDFYTDATQNEITDFFTKDESGNYKQPIAVRQQNFDNLLNQMPIEAHEAEKRMLVTQAMKTVYSNIRLDGEYQLPSGKVLTGEGLRAIAMNAINELSDRGLKRILNEFHAVKDENGKYRFKDLKGISSSLIKDMLASGADTDVLEQLSLDEDGKFKIPLSASVVARQLVSKFISKVNKETIDINLPGGTFVQMSSFGLKSIEKISDANVGEYSKYVINKGERLKLAYDDNSMECVISINLLKHIIPDYENMSFAEARQWLIDNNIIGDNASPSAMAYRVPTQGMSSIAALRIKDVVMSQAGDIIILPDEFTARTGSDFDIDKLFLTRYNYTVKKTNILDKEASREEVSRALEGFEDWLDETIAIGDKGYITRRNSLKRSDAINEYLRIKKSNIGYDAKDGKYKKYKTVAVKTEYDFNKFMQENSQEAIENLLIDTFMASLLDYKNFHDTTRPLDVPVKIMKKEIVEEYFPEEKVNLPMYEYSEEYQDRLKQDFADSKSGIGPFALNNPHHVLGQLVQLEMNTPKGLSNFSNLHKVSSIDGIHILDWLSSAISAHVDVAKDNYIIKLNVNSFTYNMVNLCFRAGAGKNTMLFVSQEIIKELAQASIQSKGNYAMDKSKPMYRRYKEKETEIIKKFTDKAKSLAKTKEQQEELDLLIHGDNLTDSILFESSSDDKRGYLETLISKYKNNERDFDYYYGQLLVYKLFKKLDPLAKSLANLVKVSQIDTKKFGKNAIEMNQFLDKVRDMYKDPYFSSEMVKKFFEKTFLQNKLENSIEFTLDLLGSISIQSKSEYYDIFRSFINSAGLSAASNEQFTSTVTNAIDAYWRSVALYPNSDSPLVRSLKDIRDMFVGPNTIAKRLNKLKKDIINDSINGGNKYPIITVSNGRISNLFLNSITGVTDSSGKSIDYVRLDYSDSVSSNISRQIREYWKELLDSDIPELKEFARDLVKYAIFNGHGSEHLNSLFKFIPTQALEEFGYYDVVRDIEDGTIDLKGLLTRDDIDEIFRNNWQDNTLVPIINTSNKNVYLHREMFGNKQKVIAIKGSDKRSICTDSNDKPLYHPYVKIRNKNSTGNYDLYKFIGVFEKQEGEKVTYKPLYILVNKKGFKESGKGVITEYMSASTFGNYKSSRYSVVPGNNVAPTFKTYDNNFMEDIPELLENFIIPRVNSQTKKNDAPGLSGKFIPLSTIDYMFRLDANNNSNTNLITNEMDEDGEIVQNVEEMSKETNTSPVQQDLFNQEQTVTETSTPTVAKEPAYVSQFPRGIVALMQLGRRKRIDSSVLSSLKEKDKELSSYNKITKSSKEYIFLSNILGNILKIKDVKLPDSISDSLKSRYEELQSRAKLANDANMVIATPRGIGDTQLQESAKTFSDFQEYSAIFIHDFIQEVWGIDAPYSMTKFFAGDIFNIEGYDNVSSDNKQIISSNELDELSKKGEQRKNEC